MGNFFITESKEIRNKSKAQLIFSDFYFYDKLRQKREHLSRKDVDLSLRKCKRYIEYYSNLDPPKGIKIKVLKLNYQKNSEQLIVNIKFQVKNKIYQNDYQKYIESPGGPFEIPWDDAIANFYPPQLLFS